MSNSREIYVEVTAEDSRNIYKASVVHQDQCIDMALLKAESELPYYATIAQENENCLPGDDVVILGYPFGSKLHDNVMELNLSFSKGYISSLQNKDGLDCVLLDISAKAGNSGSPVIDVSTGKVIGILCGSVLNHSQNLTEEINYMRPIKYFWDLFTEE